MTKSQPQSTMGDAVSTFQSLFYVAQELTLESEGCISSPTPSNLAGKLRF